MKKFWIFSFLLFTACGQQKEAPIRSDVPVHVAKAKEGEVPIYLETIGNIVSKNLIELKSQVTGKLLEANVPRGRRVEKGELVFTIDPKPFEIAVNRAKATLLKSQIEAEFAKSRLDRYKNLVKKDFISPLEYDDLERQSNAAIAQVLIDVADLELREVDLSYCYIKSPINGILGSYFIDPGNWLKDTENEVLAEVRQISPIDVLFTLSQKEFQRVHPLYAKEELKVEALLPYGSEEVFLGGVTFIDNHLSEEARTIKMKATFENKEEKLWPGLFSKVRIFLEMEKKAVLVPFAAVQVGQKGDFIFVVKRDSTVEKREVKVGERYNEDIRILEGVSSGETVVTNGQINLRQGSRVNVVEES